jgi:hypothetical protein
LRKRCAIARIVPKNRPMPTMMAGATRTLLIS